MQVFIITGLRQRIVAIAVGEQADLHRQLQASVAVRKFASFGGQVESELPNQSHTSKATLAGVPMNPKFAKELAARKCELRIRDTGFQSLARGLRAVKEAGPWA